jgi:hypothetical protein
MLDALGRDVRLAGFERVAKAREDLVGVVFRPYEADDVVQGTSHQVGYVAEHRQRDRIDRRDAKILVDEIDAHGRPIQQVSNCARASFARRWLSTVRSIVATRTKSSRAPKGFTK